MPRKSDMTPEAWARYLAQNRASVARRKADPERHRKHLEAQYAAKRLRPKKPPTEAQTAKRNAAQQRWRLRRMADHEQAEAIREAARAYQREWRHRNEGSRPAAPPAKASGSVLLTAAPSAHRDLLATISALAPRYDDRDEIIAEACLLALTGLSVPDAVREARRAVNRAGDVYRYAVPIHDCAWL